MAPGQFRLYLVPEAVANMGDRIEGELDAGKIYFATVSGRWKGFKINALNPRTPDQRWQHREAWLVKTPRVQMDPDRVDEVVQGLGDTDVVLQTVDRYVEGLDEAHREVRTVRAEDGL